jgi:hypothetical protein
MSISRNVYDGPCHEYPGLRKEITWINHTEIYIYIDIDGMNEKGWNFRKDYKDYHSALDSLSEYLKWMKEKAVDLPIEPSFTPEIIDDSVRRIKADIRNERVFLPDNGRGYKYQ